MLKPSEHNEAFDSHPESAQSDLLLAIWRWKFLPIIGTILGLSAGYLYFAKQPPAFQSLALVQVVYPGSESAGIDPLNSSENIRGKSRLDESMIIKSVKVIDLAINSGKLGEHPYLAGKSNAEIRDWIVSPSRLTVQPAGRDANTSLIEIRFQSDNSEICQLVVESIIAGYDSYLGNAYRKFGEEVITVVTQAESRLRSTYEEIAKKNAAFRESAPMVWLGEEANNHYAENCVQIQKAMNDIEIETGKLSSLVKYIQNEEKKGRTPESIIPMLTTDNLLKNSILHPTAPTPETTDSSLVAASATPLGLPYGSAERRAALVELKIKEQELLDTVGEGHPAVATTRRRIDLLTEHIAAVAEAEAQIKNEAKQAKQSKDTVPEPEDPSRKIDWWKRALQDRLAALKLQQDSLNALANRNEGESKKLGKYLNEYKVLNSEMASAQALLEGVTGTLSRMHLLPQDKVPSLQTLTPPSLGSFAGPKLLPFLISGGALGFLVLAGLAIAIDFIDKGFHSPEEIRGILGLPVVGHVPLLKKTRRKRDNGMEPTLCTIDGSNNFGCEAFRLIRTGLFYNESGARNRVIQVTSPVPGDGKSTISTNIAISIAQSGRSVLLIDADMRRPRIAKMFGMQSEVGLADVLRGKMELDDAIQSSPIENLNVLAGCRPVKDPSELLSNSNFADLVEVLREKFDYVIVDTPPVLAVSDPCSVAAVVDGVLLAVRLRRNSKPLARQASQLLDHVGARKVGVIVNGVAAGGSYEYHYNQYGYEELAAK
jgi:polysaccharide biosynthesis transport protein